MKRAAAVYLYFAPLLIVAMWYVYHGLGLTAGIAGAAVCFCLSGWMMWIYGILDREQLSTTFGLARLLLVGGGMMVWLFGAAGPPLRENVTLAHYNNTGLSIGIFVVLCGLAVLKDDLVKCERGSLATVALIAALVAFVTWLLQSGFTWSALDFAASDLARKQRPEWLQFQSPAQMYFERFRVGLMYGAGALFAEAAVLTHRMSRWPASLLIAFSVVGMALGIADSGPFFVPAFSCIVPYLLSLAIHKRSPTSAQIQASREHSGQALSS